jgi:hypothetical protein
LDLTLSDPIPELIHYLAVRIRSYPIRSRSLYTFHRNVSDPIRSDAEAYASSHGMNPILFDPMPEHRPLLPEWIRFDPLRYRSLYILSGIGPTLSDPIPELIHYLLVWNRSYPIRSLSLYTIFRNGADPIRSDAEAYTSSLGMDPILSEPIPEQMPLLPEWIRPYPIPHRSLHIFLRIGPDPIRPDTGAYTLSSGADPILSDPKPELINLLPECIRTYPIRCRSLYILSRNGSDPIRSDTRAFTPSSGMDPTRSDPIPKLTHLLPKRARPYPTLCRSVYLIFRCGSDPIRSEAGAYTSSTRVYPILSDPIPKLLHRIRIALSPIKSQRRSVRMRCDSINLVHDFYITPKGPLYNPIRPHPDRIGTDQKSTVVFTVAMRFYRIPKDPCRFIQDFIWVGSGVYTSLATQLKPYSTYADLGFRPQGIHPNSDKQ